ELDGFRDAAGWLRGAAEVILALVEGELLERDKGVGPLTVIALRQTQLGATDDARATLDALDGFLDDASLQDRLLMIDVARETGEVERVLTWERQLHDDQTLPAVRWADLVRDTATVDGDPAALALVDELTGWSRDEELLAASRDLAAQLDPPDETRSERYAELAEEAVAAREQITAITRQLAEWQKTLEQAKEYK
ncbi:MAG: hypothetical protein ACYTGC_14375, partial [Planctomycetota bacterium]